jgi:hypothetical protein
MFDIVSGLSEDGSARAHAVRRLALQIGVSDVPACRLPIGMGDLERRRGAPCAVWIDTEKPIV